MLHVVRAQLNGRFGAMLELHELLAYLRLSVIGANGTGEATTSTSHEKEQRIRPIDWHMPCAGDGNMLQGEV